MSRSFAPAGWKGQESTGNHPQVGFPFMAAVRGYVAAPVEFVAACNDIGAMRFAAQGSGLDDFEIADQLHISHGYMSKVLKGTAGLYGRRLVAFMRTTGSLAPLQWLAEQMGCDVVMRDSRAAEVAALKARLREMGEAA